MRRNPIRIIIWHNTLALALRVTYAASRLLIMCGGCALAYLTLAPYHRAIHIIVIAYVLHLQPIFSSFCARCRDFFSGLGFSVARSQPPLSKQWRVN
jgi:hypothetical protein